ncbi:MAG: hypothetical protein KC493_15205 [Bacteriovoracaceae bacterium]|nr:hypothetical protein [Bacteriovoracaceae bacterium]
MKTRLKVTGIYDQTSFSLLQEEGINLFGFDFRVRSFNFLQQHNFLELLKANYQTNFHFDLIFQDEKDFVIQKMVDDLSETLSKMGKTKDHMDHFSLHFTDAKGKEFYDSFKTPYVWEYHPMEDLNKLATSEYLKGIILPYELLSEYNTSGEFHQFVAKFLKSLSNNGSRKGISLGLKMDWKSDLFPSLNEFLVFDYWQIDINSNIETSYRQISKDQLKLSVGEVRKGLTP